MKPSFPDVMTYVSIFIPKTYPVRYGFAYSIAFIFYFILGVSDANSTSVMTIRTSNEIIIGADSFLGDEISKTVKSICKIRQAGNTYFVASGFPIIKGKDIDFNVYKISAEVFSQNIPVQQKIETYDKIIKFNLRKIANTIRRNKRLFKTVFQSEDGMVVKTLLVVNTPQFPIMYQIDHSIISSAKEPASVKTSIKNFTDKLTQNEMDIVWTDDERKFCAQLFDKGIAFNVVDNIRKCIEIQSRERPKVVKTPVDILRITSSKVEWIQHKPECPDITNGSTPQETSL